MTAPGPAHLSRRGLLAALFLIPLAGTIALVWWDASSKGGGSGAPVARRIGGAVKFTPAPARPVAPLSDFDRDWASRPVGGVGQPGLVVRTPAPVEGGLRVGAVNLIGYSRVCTHLGCLVDLTPAAAGAAPQLDCPCHGSVFDPAGAGAVLRGPAAAPLPRLELKLEGDAVTVIGREG